LDQDKRKIEEKGLGPRLRRGARLGPQLAGLNAAGGLLLVAYAVLANLSTQVSIQLTLFRGPLLLLLPVAGFLLAALTLVGVIGASREQWARRLLIRIPAWGTCILWLFLWAVILIITIRLI
jgi:hypothetical protein